MTRERAGQGGKQHSVEMKSFIPVLPDMRDPDIPHKHLALSGLGFPEKWSADGFAKLF